MGRPKSNNSIKISCQYCLNNIAKISKVVKSSGKRNELDVHILEDRVVPCWDTKIILIPDKYSHSVK